MKKSNVFIFIAGAAVLTVLFILRNMVYPQAVVEVCCSIFNYASGVIGIFSRFSSLFKAWSVYGIIFKLALILISCGIGAFVTVAFKQKITDDAAGVYFGIGRVIKYGLAFVALTVILVLLFINSVVGIFFAGILIIISAVFAVLGSIPFLTALGSYLQKLYNGDYRNITVNFIIGLLTLCVCSSIYGFAEPTMLFFYPVMSIGSFLVSVRNSIMNIHFETEFISFEKERFDRNKIRDIITKDIK